MSTTAAPSDEAYEDNTGRTRLAEARRAAHANGQALQDARAEARGAASGDQARTDLAKLRDLIRQATHGDLDDHGLAAWVALHEMYGPAAPGSGVYTVVEVAHLDWLHHVADLLGDLNANGELGDSPTANNLRTALDEVE